MGLDEDFNLIFGAHIAVPSGFEIFLELASDWRERLGDRLHNKVSVTATGTRLNGLDVLAPDQLWRLSCGGRPVADAEFEHLSRMVHLEELFLNRTKITDAGLHALTPLRSLRYLDLDDCNNITDIGLRVIGAIESLEVLLLFGTRITDAGLAAFTRHPNLAVLDLRHTLVEGNLEPLASVPRLREVRLPKKAHRHHHADALRRARPDIVLL